MAATTAPPAQPQADETNKYYGFSVIFAGVKGLFRGFLPFLAVIVVNAIVQAVLIGTLNALPGFNASFIISLIISAVSLWIGLYFLCQTALEAPFGRVSLRQGTRINGRGLLIFTVWVVVLYAVLMVLLILYVPLGLLWLVVTPFTALAATDARTNAIGANFRVIGNRFFRWLITIIILSILLLFVYLIQVAFGFFIGSWLGSGLGWIVNGVIAAWFLSALAALYRSTPVGRRQA
ncbi:MAG: hypothetical protein ACOYD0_12430 [Candidatus Nanopelagicales bacterium]